MAVSKQEVVLTFNADTSGVEKGIGKVEQSVQNTSQATSGLTTQLDKMTGGAVTGFRNMVSGVKTAITGMKSLKVAVAATGIGLLVVAVASLVSYFTDTERGAQKLRKITAVLGAVMDKLRDVVIGLGENLFNAFSNPKQAVLDLWETIKTNLLNRLEGMLEFLPKIGEAIKQALSGDFSGAAKTAADAAGKVALGVENVTDKMVEAAEAAAEFAAEVERTAKAAQDLADRENKLKVAERDFLSVRAETNKLIAEKRLLVEDESLSYAQRIGALDEAIAAEERTIAQELKFARERAAILEQKAALAESDEETLQAVAEAQAAVIELETRSLQTQKRLEGERQSLIVQRESRAKQEQAAAQKAAEEAQKAAEEELAARQKLEDELYFLTLSAREQEELALMQKYEERIAIAGDDEGLIKAATEQLNADLADIDGKYRKQEEDALAEEQRLKDEAAAKDAERRAKELEEERATAEAIKKAKLDIAKSSLDALAALNEAFTGESEAEQKRGFERSKKIQTAQALISTYESAVQAFKSLAGIPVVGPALGGAAAAAAVVAGLANVKKIQSQTFQGASAAGGGDTYQGAGTAPTAGATTIQPPTLDLGFLGAGAGQQGPIQAYVLAENVSTAQQANQKIQDQATL